MVWKEAATALHKAHELQKPPLLFTVFLASFIGLAFFFYLVRNHRSKASRGIPPGTFGWPLIGETFEFLGCQRRGSPLDFFDKRTQKYGNLFATSLVGHPTGILQSGRQPLLVLQREQTGCELMAQFRGKSLQKFFNYSRWRRCEEVEENTDDIPKAGSPSEICGASGFDDQTSPGRALDRQR